MNCLWQGGTSGLVQTPSQTPGQVMQQLFIPVHTAGQACVLQVKRPGACLGAEIPELSRINNLVERNPSKHGEMRTFYRLAGIVIVQATKHRLCNLLLMRGCAQFALFFGVGQKGAFHQHGGNVR